MTSIKIPFEHWLLADPGKAKGWCTNHHHVIIHSAVLAKQACFIQDYYYFFFYKVLRNNAEQPIFLHYFYRMTSQCQYICLIMVGKVEQHSTRYFKVKLSFLLFSVPSEYFSNVLRFLADPGEARGCSTTTAVIH